METASSINFDAWERSRCNAIFYNYTNEILACLVRNEIALDRNLVVQSIIDGKQTSNRLMIASWSDEAPYLTVATFIGHVDKYTPLSGTEELREYTDFIIFITEEENRRFKFRIGATIKSALADGPLETVEFETMNLLEVIDWLTQNGNRIALAEK